MLLSDLQELMHFNLVMNDTTCQNIHILFASKLQSLYVGGVLISYSSDEGEEVANCYISRIEYMRQKYTSLFMFEFLILNYGYANPSMENLSFVEEPLAHMISSMPHLKTYAMKLYPINGRNVDA